MVERDWPQDATMGLKRYGNFKPDRFAANAGRQPWKTRRELREGNSNQHLFLVRSLWCCLGHERQGVQPHHLEAGPARKSRGAGMKSLDRWCVPLVWWRHSDLHSLGSRNELKYFLAHGINPYALADALWEASGNLARMGRVLVAHQMDATRRRLQAERLDILLVDLTPDEWGRL